jgi:TetR/AcrR family transcriptional regulator, cholesterol catabolism regulator
VRGEMIAGVPPRPKTRRSVSRRAGYEDILIHRRQLEQLGLSSSSADLSRGNGTRVRALRAAIQLFAQRGFDTTGMRDIAAAVGVKAPALYNHFASKEEILGEAMEYALAEFFAGIVERMDREPPERWLEAFVCGHVTFQLTRRDIARANDTLLNVETMRRLLPAERHERLVIAQRSYYRILRDLIAVEPGRAANVDPRVAAFAVISMCDGVIGWTRPDGELNADEVANRVWAIVATLVGRTAA